MTSDVEASFIEAMAEAPDDPGPRIVFADWLLERGDPRGEYFRLHHEVRHGKATKLVEKRAAKVATRELARIRATQFAPDGLVADVSTTLAELLTGMPERFSLGPIHHVRLFGPAGPIDELARCERLRWVFGLGLGTLRVTPAEAALLVASPHVHRLRRASITDTAIGPNGLAPLAQLALETLDVSRTSLANDIAWLLPAMPRLHTLAIAGNQLDADSVAKLLAVADKLAVLDLSNNRITRTGARAIAAATHLANLRSLDLAATYIDDVGLQALIEAPHLQQLEKLSLDHNPLTARSGNLLLTTRHLPALRELGIDQCHDIPRPIRHVIMQRFAQR